MNIIQIPENIRQAIMMLKHSSKFQQLLNKPLTNTRNVSSSTLLSKVEDVIDTTIISKNDRTNEYLWYRLLNDSDYKSASPEACYNAIYTIYFAVYLLDNIIDASIKNDVSFKAKSSTDNDHELLKVYVHNFSDLLAGNSWIVVDAWKKHRGLEPVNIGIRFLVDTTTSDPTKRPVQYRVYPSKSASFNVSASDMGTLADFVPEKIQKYIFDVL